MSDGAMIAVMGMGFSMFLCVILAAIGIWMYNKGHLDDWFEKEAATTETTTAATVSNPNTSNTSNVTFDNDKDTYFYNTTCTIGDKSYRLLSVHADTNRPWTICKREEDNSVWKPQKVGDSADYYYLYNKGQKKYMSTNDDHGVILLAEKNGEYSQWIVTKQNSNSDHISIQNRKTRRFLNVKDNTCKESDKDVLQMIDITVNAADAPDGAKWASIKFADGWGKAITDKDKRCD